MERSSKKKVQAAAVWKRAIVHFSLCFIMGFFTGFAPTANTGSTFFSTYKYNYTTKTTTTTSSKSLPPHLQTITNRSADDQEQAAVMMMSSTNSPDHDQPAPLQISDMDSTTKRLVIMVTPINNMIMRAGKGYHHQQQQQMVLLRRMADTVRLVEPPLLWIVVEGATDNESTKKEVREVLRKTGVMYRHLVLKNNFTELNHHRNLALNHIEQHRLSGIVHFADLSNVYHLDFFHHLRHIEVFGTWPVALLSANRKKVIIEGPVCDSSSQVIGWHLGKTIKQQTPESDHQKPLIVNTAIHVSNFAFNSSILWDPERWGRPTSVQATSQNSLKFVKQVAFDDETKLKGIPEEEECSKIMVWRLHIPLQLPPTHQ